MIKTEPQLTDFDPTRTCATYDELRGAWELNRDMAEMPLHVLRRGDYLDRFGADERGSVCEPAAQYAWRRNAAVAMDHCADLINLRVDNIFRAPPVRQYQHSPFGEFLGRFLSDVDGGGTGMDDLMRRALRMHYINGVDLVVDKSAAPAGAEPATLAQERQMGLLPCVHLFSALERLDWAVDHAGRYVWARYALGGVPAADETAGPGDVRRYLTVMADQWRLYEVDAEGPTRLWNGPIALGLCPVVSFYYKTASASEYPKVPLSLLSRIAPIARYLLNLVSQIQIDVYRNIGFLVATGVSPDQVPSEITPMGCWTLPEGAQLKDVAGDVNHIRIKIELAQMLMEAILRIGKLTGSTGDLQSRASSGTQVAVERTDLDNEMQATACQAEQVEREIVRLAVSRHQGRLVAHDEIGYSVQYNKKFVLTSVADLVAQARQFVSMGIHQQVPTLLKVQLRKILDALTKDDDADYRTALNEIESAAFAGI
ncbi:MAG: hypothetical protein ABFD92_09240 [Planctomycetaceae bacterium]|nr:hypothetical protein [Planctomycetaceae bacterium]